MTASVSPVAWAVETYDGATFVLLSRQSVDVTRQQQQLQQASLNLDENPWYFYVGGRSTPARFQFGNGATSSGGLTRLQLGMGGGFGKPRTGTGPALAAGLLVDGGYATEFPRFVKQHRLTKASVTQGLFYANGSASGVSFTFGALISSTANIQANGDLGSTDGKVACCRLGAPSEAIKAASDDPVRSTAYVLSARHESGIGIGASIAGLRTIDEQGQLTQKNALATFLARLQPERLLRQYGLFLAGFDRLAPEVDYYADRYAKLRAALDKRSRAEAVDLPQTPTRAMYEVPIGVDNLLGRGVRARFVTQLSPDVRARLFEIGHVHSFILGRFVEIDTGVRAVVFSRNGSYVPSTDAFVGLRVFKRQASWTASYSYNSPDSTTFFPVPNAHVVGFQVIYGPVEVVQPLVPILGRDGRGKRGDDEERPPEGAPPSGEGPGASRSGEPVSTEQVPAPARTDGVNK